MFSVLASRIRKLHRRHLLCVAEVLIASAALPVEAQQAAKLRRDQASPQIAAVEKLLAIGHFDEAKQQIEELLQQDPKSVEAYNLLGIAEADQKNEAGALDAFQRALKLNPNSVKTHNNLASFYLAEGKADLGEKEFKQALALAPADTDANYNYALLLLAKGSPAAAIPHLLRIKPQTDEAQLNLVRAYLQAGRVADAQKTASTLSDKEKDNVQIHFSLGILLASEKQYKAAQLELQKANALKPETFEILFNLGQAYLRGGDYPSADLILSRALKLKPDSAETLYLQAQVLSEEEKPVDALELLVRAHKLAPENTDVIFLMARLSMTQNFYEDAIPLLVSGIKIAPKRPDLRAALGESYFMSGKTEKAIDEFQKLIEIDPSARSYAFMGLSYRHLGRFDEARKYFEEGVKQDPHNASCLFNLGYIEERQGNYARADELFQQSLKSNPDFAEALLELANLRTRDKKFEEAAELLRKYVKVSHDPATGYYKLAMVERSMHQTAAAQRDLNVFQTLSKNSATGPYPYQHLFDYLNNRTQLSAKQRTELDVTELNAQIQKNPGQPQDLYLLAETYLKLAQVEDAKKTITQLDQISANDYRMQTGVGVLLASHRLYDDAIQHFQTALKANPDSDDIKFDLADTYFHKRQYEEALSTAQTVSAAGQQDDAYLALLGDIYAHLGDSAKSEEIFGNAISRNPDNDQYYLSLALVQLRAADLSAAQQTLKKGLARIPASGKILWGLGVVSVLQGDTTQAAQQLERAVELLPEWAGSYSTLGVFYYQTGQIDKAREVLDRFKGSNAGGLDVNRIEDALSHAPANSSPANRPMPMEARQQLLQLALSIADRTL
ncbi:MAG TPA: tetratricopeptide repeat protein [Terriglobales bacterium]|nr:tetratricopeptide repeat protein [Terriglobales bacterium]